MNKNCLDEMQLQKRNAMGNQMFMLMYWIIFFNSILNGTGIKWLAYPADVLIIITVCMGIYLVRLIKFNAFLPPVTQNRKTVIILGMAISFLIILAVSAIYQFTQSPESNIALIGMIASGVGFIITLIVAVVIKRS